MYHNGNFALVAQWMERLTTNQKVGGSSPSGRGFFLRNPGDTKEKIMPQENHHPTDPFVSAASEIDVEQIMNSIKERIREKQNSGILTQEKIEEIENLELISIPDFNEIPNVYEPNLYPPASSQSSKPPFQPFQLSYEDEGGSGVRGLVKKTLKVFRKVFSPFIRFFSRPIYNELKQFTVDRYNENSRLIYEFDRSAFYSKEYIRILHNALSNLIHETTKLKVDQEMLKTRIKVLEDKVEFVENRERAIEKKVFESHPSSVTKETTPKE